MNNISRKAAIVLAVALTLVVPQVAFAADTGATTETLNIPAEFVLQNVPATLTYTQSGDVNTGWQPSDTPLAFSGQDQYAGMRASDGPAGYTGSIFVSFASSFGSGTRLFVASSNLSGGYPGPIPVTNRTFTGMGTTAGLDSPNSPILSGDIVPANTNPVLLATWNGVGANSHLGVRPVVKVPGGSVGTFTGTITFSITGPVGS